MPYIVIKTSSQEVHRCELDRGLVIGRAPDCDITVRDILLSRRHCRLQPSDDGWMVQDLGSKNGSVLNGERLQTPKLLTDNNVVRFGRSKIIFHAGLPEEDFADQILAPTRPATPGDSLAGTLSGFTLLLPGEGEIPEDMPCPQPRAKDPPAYDKEELQTLLTAIASSSWDSVYAEARQPLRIGKASEPDQPAADHPEPKERRRSRPSSPTDFSLQVSTAAAPTPPIAPIDKNPRKIRWIPKFRPSLHMAVAAVWVGLLILLNNSQKPLASGSTDHTPPVGLVQSDNVQSAPITDGELLKAADLEPQETTPGSAKPPMKFDPTVIKAAAGRAALAFPLVW